MPNFTAREKEKKIPQKTFQKFYKMNSFIVDITNEQKSAILRKEFAEVNFLPGKLITEQELYNLIQEKVNI